MFSIAAATAPTSVGAPIVCTPCQLAKPRLRGLRGTEGVSGNLILFGLIGISIYALGNWMATSPSRRR